MVMILTDDDDDDDEGGRSCRLCRFPFLSLLFPNGYTLQPRVRIFLLCLVCSTAIFCTFMVGPFLTILQLSGR